MTDNQPIEQRLQALSRGHYSRADLNQTVDLLHAYAIKSLYSLLMKGWRLPLHDEQPEAAALSLIGPLFATNERGQFHRIARFLETRRTWRAIHDELQRWVAGQIRRELIHLFMQLDSSGKIEHQSLSYVVKKLSLKKGWFHGDWVIHEAKPRDLATPEEIAVAFRSVPPGEQNMTKALTNVLRALIIEQHLAVTVHDLFDHLDAQFVGLGEDAVLDEDPLLQESIEYHIHQTVLYLDEQKLSRYQTAGKLTANTRQSFKKALADHLRNFATGEIDHKLKMYLENHIPGLTTEEYQNRYRSMWEYLARQTRDQFSDRMKNDYRVK